MMPNKGHENWYKYVDVNGAYMHGRYEGIMLKSLCAASNLIVLPCKMDKWTDGQWLASQTNTTDYIDP